MVLAFNCNSRSVQSRWNHYDRGARGLVTWNLDKLREDLASSEFKEGAFATSTTFSKGHQKTTAIYPPSTFGQLFHFFFFHTLKQLHLLWPHRYTLRRSTLYLRLIFPPPVLSYSHFTSWPLQVGAFSRIVLSMKMTSHGTSRRRRTLRF
jgi:hypothetical protein